MDPWRRGREVARGVLRSSPKPEERPIFCHWRGIENFCRLFSTQQRPNVFVSDVWMAPATCHRSFCVTREWVGAPNERAPSDFMAQSLVLSIDVCPGLGNLAASTKHLAETFASPSWANIGSGIIFFGVFEKFETFCSKICAISERYRNLLTGIFQNLAFYGNIAFPLSPVLIAHFPAFP